MCSGTLSGDGDDDDGDGDVMVMMVMVMMMMIIVIIIIPNSYHSVTYHCYSFIPFRQSLQGSCVLLLQPTWHHIALR